MSAATAAASGCASASEATTTSTAPSVATGCTAPTASPHTIESPITSAGATTGAIATTTPTTIDATATPAATTYEDEAHDYNSRGWAYLADGRAAKALHAFSREAASRSRHGAPKVGYALAKTSLGDHKDAVWAMRRAFRVDPHGAGDVYLDEELHHRVRSLADHYAGGAGHGYTDVDAEFMSAALRYLLHDHEAARHAVNAALEHGDHRASTRNLADLLHDDDYGDGGHEDDGY